MKKILVIIFAIVILISIIFINNSEANSEKNVLFIGNSKTMYNNLPQKVQKLSESDLSTTIPDLNCKLVSEGGKGLKWFYENRTKFDTLLKLKWDYIVLQETRSTAIDDSKLEDFKSGAKKLLQYLKDKDVIDENTVIIYHAAWVNAKEGSTIYDLNKLKEDQNKTNQNYRIVKDYIEQEMNIKSKIAYTGNNYISCLENADMNMKIGDLYRTNESTATHPTIAGSYLAACTIYETIFDTKIQDYSGEGTANPYDNILDNKYDGAVSSAKSGNTEAVKKEFREKIQYITRLYTDITSPEITDIQTSNEQWTNKDVKISFKADDNIYRTTINGEELQSEDENYSYTVTSNGDYNIEVMDLVGRTTSITKNISNIDKILPTDTLPTAENTANSITVTNQQNDEESGIDKTKTKYRLTDSQGSTGEWQKSNVFTGLKHNQVYYIQTQSTDKAGNIQNSKITSVQTNGIPELTSENTRIELSNTEWTNQNIIAIITTTEQGYQLQTKVGTNGTWENVSTQEMIENNTIYARLTDGTNAGESVSFDIDNIDKILPTDTQPIVENTVNSITVKIQQKDEQSGIDETKTKYRITDSQGKTGDWQKSNVFTGLKQNQEYYIQTQVTDNAGNISNSLIVKVITNKIPNLTNSNTKIQLSNSNWTNEEILVKIEVVDEKLLEEIRKGTYIIETRVELENDKENDEKNYKEQLEYTFSSNGKIYIRLTDGVNIGNEYFYEIANIDNNLPTIVGVENNMKYSGNAIIREIYDNESGIKEITLEKDGKKINFTIGTPLSENGLYKITVIDNANNSITKIFEIVKKVDIDNDTNNNTNNDVNDDTNNNNDNNNDDNNNSNNNNSNGSNANDDKNSNNSNNANKDNSTTNNEIPKAGNSGSISILIVILCAVSVIVIQKLKNYKDI